MKRYMRIMLGSKSKHADECYKGNFIGADYGIDIDLSQRLPENWREFNQKFIPIWMEKNPGKSKISAGLACGSLWTVAKGIKIGDTVLCPNGAGAYYVGEVMDNYAYHPEGILPHRRTVNWLSTTIDRSAMSATLKSSTGSSGTVCDISNHAEEIDGFIISDMKPPVGPTGGGFVDVVTFALEKHLEDFLIQNWKATDLGRQYDIYEEDGELVGRQYPSDTGPLDILAISKDKKELLVVELKKGRVSDSVVGQIQRYMGYVLEELAEEGQNVKGVIIGLEDDLRIRRALAVTNNIEFYRYEVNFKLFKN